MPHHLLLADDSVTIQRVIKLTFADEDVDVETVGDGDQAVASIDKAPPDIVLADVAMPGRTGYDVAQHIRDTPRLAHIPVVLLTGAFEPVDEVRASQVGCDAVLAKPFEPELVVSRVRELLSRPRPVAAASPVPVDALRPAPVPEPAAPPAPHPPAQGQAADPTPAGVSTHDGTTVAPRLAVGASAPIGTAPVNVPASSTPAAPAPVAPVIAAAVASAAPATGAAAGAQSTRNNPADIDAYFDRLDEAFATLATTPRPVTPMPTSPEPRPAPPLSLVPPASPVRSAVPAPPAAAASSPSEPAVRSLVEAFEGLLGPQGPVVTPSTAPRAAASPVTSASSEPAGLTEAQLSEVVDRVIDRLTGRLGAGTVNDIVTRVAERLVREEIAQIKKRL